MNFKLENLLYTLFRIHFKVLKIESGQFTYEEQLNNCNIYNSVTYSLFEFFENLVHILIFELLQAC